MSQGKSKKVIAAGLLVMSLNHGLQQRVGAYLGRSREILRMQVILRFRLF